MMTQIVQGARRRLLPLSALAVLSGGLTGSPAHAIDLPTGFADNLVAGSLASPTAFAFAPDGRLFVCRQSGSVRIIKNGALLATPFLSLTVDPSGERGLLGIAFDPNFAANGYVYLYYTVPSSPRHNRISRFTANGDVAVAGSEFVLMDLDNLSGATNHNGGAIHFGPDGKLYIAVGENANSANSQTLNNRLGKILRINADGIIPSDNPFYNTTLGGGKAIWALGLRNPYTFAFQPGTGRLYINDVGQNVWEEINIGVAGANYGWPNTEGDFNQSSFPNFTRPLYTYSHGGDPGGCAITGGTFYNPAVSAFPASYVGKYFFADYCGGWIRTLDPDTGSSSAFATNGSAAVDLQAGPDGALYYLTRNSGGQVRKITFAAQVSGAITLPEYTSVSGTAITLEFRPVGGGTPFTRTATLNASGGFTLTDVPVGNYNVAIQGDKWLQRVVPVDTRNGSVSGVNATLLGGDSNGDNSVDALDLADLIDAFNTTEGEAGYNPSVDFNGDNAADALDLAILITNFNTEGDA